MGAETKIEWCSHTFNPWRGCTKVSEGCAHCYADAQAKRNPATLGIWGDKGSRVVASEAMWKLPLKWEAKAKAAGERHRVFCASMADVFEDWQRDMLDAKGNRIYVSLRGTRSWEYDDGSKGFAFEKRALTMSDVRARLFALIDATPNLDWLLLTKRPENIAKMMPAYFPGGYMAEAGAMNQEEPRPNVWLGTSVENQAAAGLRIDLLLKAPAVVRFLSCEPLLGPVMLTTECLIPANEDHPNLVGYMAGGDDGKSVLEATRGEALKRCGIDWVIVGGESGPNARPMHPDWARSLRDQCQAAGVPFFFKQWGEWAPVRGYDPLHRSRHFCFDGPSKATPELAEYNGMSHANVFRFGKAAAGRLLDGREWSELPEMAEAT